MALHFGLFGYGSDCFHVVLFYRRGRANLVFPVLLLSFLYGHLVADFPCFQQHFFPYSMDKLVELFNLVGHVHRMMVYRLIFCNIEVCRDYVVQLLKLLSTEIILGNPDVGLGYLCAFEGS